MRWLSLPLEKRKQAVAEIDELIMAENPDRFWYSHDQDGEYTQRMSILLPCGDDVYHDVRIQTTQFKAFSLLAEAECYVDPLSPIPQVIIDQMGIVGEEQFEVNEQHPTGVLYDVVLDVPGLTHVVIDSLLDDFLRRGGMPPQPKKTNPANLARRLVEAQDSGHFAEQFFKRLKDAQ